MIIRLVLALAAIGFIYWLLKKGLPKDKDKRRTAIFYLCCYGVALFLAIAVFTGKLNWIGAVFAALLALAKFGAGAFLRLMPMLGLLKKHAPFAQPRFKTPHLDVAFDLNSNKLSGHVIDGPHSGRELNTLSIEELRELEAFYQQQDKRSYYLVRVLIQQGGAKFEQENNYSSAGDPSIEEALLILGLTGQPSKKDIIRAHRSLIQKFHPDRGGNDYLASRINLAKDILLKEFDA